MTVSHLVRPLDTSNTHSQDNFLTTDSEIEVLCYFLLFVFKDCYFRFPSIKREFVTTNPLTEISQLYIKQSVCVYVKCILISFFQKRFKSHILNSLNTLIIQFFQENVMIYSIKCFLEVNEYTTGEMFFIKKFSNFSVISIRAWVVECLFRKPICLS